MKIQKIGTDIEFILTDKQENPVSSLYFLTGTKEKPEKMSGLEKGFAFMNDNVLLEINIPPVDIHLKKASKIFMSNIDKAVAYVQKRLPININISAYPGGIYTDRDLEHPIAKVLGCDKDFNVWLKDVNPKPSAESNFRGCGFHIHISYEGPTRERTEKFMKLFDIVITSALISSVKEEKTRRRFYGRAGAFRFVDYGLEARTLSSIHLHDIDFIFHGLLWIENFYEVITKEDIAVFEQNTIQYINNCIFNLISADFKLSIENKFPDMKMKVEKITVNVDEHDINVKLLIDTESISSYSYFERLYDRINVPTLKHFVTTFLDYLMMFEINEEEKETIRNMIEQLNVPGEFANAREKLIYMENTLMTAIHNEDPIDLLQLNDFVLAP